MLPLYEDKSKPNYGSILKTFSKLQSLISQNKVRSAWTIGFGGVAEGISKMCFGNKIGFTFDKIIDNYALFNPTYGGFIVELYQNEDDLNIIGHTTREYVVRQGDQTIVNLDKMEKSYNQTLESVYPTKASQTNSSDVENISYETVAPKCSPKIKKAAPVVLIPVFPGTNCEYDTARQFEIYGAKCDIFVINNLTESGISESIDIFSKKLKKSNILMIPGGFSGGDEPDGSGKFITSFFRNISIKEEIHNLIKKRDGLILGICNGFQALIKLGLIEHGEITDPSKNSATLTYNTIGRHQSMIISTKIASTKSPWLKNTTLGQTFKMPISHGEGRFIAPKETIKKLIKNGQIATQYVDPAGNATMKLPHNPNGSYFAVEGLTSPDGRIFGKMGHSERVGADLYKNIPGFEDQLIFKAGVEYFK